MTIAIILHNLVIDVEGAKSGGVFAATHTYAEEQEDRGESDEALEDDEEAGEIKRKQLVAEIAAYRGIQLDEH